MRRCHLLASRSVCRLFPHLQVFIAACKLTRWKTQYLVNGTLTHLVPRLPQIRSGIKQGFSLTDPPACLEAFPSSRDAGSCCGMAGCLAGAWTRWSVLWSAVLSWHQVIRSLDQLAAPSAAYHRAGGRVGWGGGWTGGRERQGDRCKQELSRTLRKLRGVSLLELRLT